MRLLPILLLLLICSFPSQAQKFRLQKINNYSSKSLYTGTVYYYYSENRGSDYKNGIIDFDSAVSISSSNYRNSKSGRTYDTIDRLVHEFHATGEGTIGALSNGNTYTYDSLGRIEKSTSFQSSYKSGNSRSEYTYIYDSLNRLLHRNVTYFPSHLAPPDGPYRSTFTYDANNNIVKDVYQQYDSTNNTFVYQFMDSFVYTYDTQNRITSVAKYYYNGSVTPQQWKKEYTYNNNNKVHQYTYYTYNKDSAKFIPQDITTSNYNAAGYITEEVLKIFNPKIGYISHLKTITTYNSYGQPDTIFKYRAYHPDMTYNLLSFTHHIYGIYWPASVSEHHKQTNDIKLYPSPTSDFITISATFHENKNFIAAIVDMQGRIVRQWKETNVQQYSRTIPLTDLQSGIYAVKLIGDDLRETKQFSVVK